MSIITWRDKQQMQSTTKRALKQYPFEWTGWIPLLLLVIPISVTPLSSNGNSCHSQLKFLPATVSLSAIMDGSLYGSTAARGRVIFVASKANDRARLSSNDSARRSRIELKKIVHSQIETSNLRR